MKKFKISLVTALCFLLLVPAGVRADTYKSYVGTPYNIAYYDKNYVNRGNALNITDWGVPKSFNFDYVNSPLYFIGWYVLGNEVLSPGTYRLTFNLYCNLYGTASTFECYTYLSNGTADLLFPVTFSRDGGNFTGTSIINITSSNVSRFMIRLYPNVSVTSDLTISSYLTNVYIEYPDLGATQINDTLNSVNNSIKEMDTNINNKLDSIFNSDSPTSNNANSANSDLSSTITDYDNIESSLVDDMNTNLDSLDTNLYLLQNNEFITTAQFISNNLDRIYNSNNFIRYLVDFGLILGLILTLIGISIKRS